MKILFCPCHYIYTDISGGSELSWAFNIADRIAHKHPESVVVTGFKETKGEKGYKIIELQRDKKSLDMGAENALRFNWQVFKETEKQLKAQKFDILHHVLPFSADTGLNLCILLNKASNIPTVIGPIQSRLIYKEAASGSSSTGKPMNTFQTALKPLIKYLSNKTLNKTHKIIVINEHTKNLLLKSGINEKKIEIIPPGIDSSRFKHVSLEKKDLNILEILSVGWLVKRKGYDLVIRAIKEVTRENKNIILRIIGDGPEINRLRKLTNELNIEKFIIFEGRIPHEKIQKYYQKADIFVSMTRDETWGQMYLEAMSCGLPVITTKNIGANETIRDGHVGYLLEQEDYKSLAEKILYLIKNPNVISDLGLSAKKEVEEKYDWDSVIIPRILKIYHSLIKAKK